MCTAGGTRGVGDGVGIGKGASARGGAGWRRLDLRLLLFPSLWQEKKGLPAAPVDHLSRGEGGEEG